MALGIDRFFLLSVYLTCCWLGLVSSKLHLERQWPQLEFNFPSPEEEQIAKEKRWYVPGKSLPIDVDVHHRCGGLPSRIFVTIPRFDEGRPMTLGTVDAQGFISAYPDYGWHVDQGVNCDGMTSVFRISIDQCNRLWVMDAGKIGNVQKCPPQLLAFDLFTDRLIFRHVVNDSSYVDSSLFVTPVVDVRGQGPDACQDTYVYVADVAGFGVLVVDVARNRSWRVRHRYFYPCPHEGVFSIDGESFDLMDGVLGMALSPYQPGCERYLYFHALSSVNENVMLTSTLRNASRLSVTDLDSSDVTIFMEQRSSQSAAEAIDRNGIMYFGLMEPPSIWCWNTATEFTTQNFHQVAFDRETLQFAGGVKIVNNLKGEQELWILTSSIQRLKTGSLGPHRVNFRIHAEKIPILLANSSCLAPANGFPNEYRSVYHSSLI